MTAQLTIETFPDEAAAAYMRGKAIADPAHFGNLPAQLKQRAFTVAGIEQIDALRRVRDAIAELPEGKSWDEAKREIAAEISPYVVAPQGGRNQARAAMARAEFLLRTHGFQAYAVSRHQQQMEDIGIFPYWKYVTVGDSRVRPGHAALDGKVLRADDPWWRTHYPPWEWGCRCVVEALDEEDARTAGISTHAEMPTPERSGSFAFDPTNVAIDIDKYRKDPRFENDADWKKFFVTPAKNVKTEAPDGRSMNMWQYSLEQKAIRLGKELAARTDPSGGKVEWIAAISRKTGATLVVNSGTRNSVRAEVPADEDVSIVHTHPSGQSIPSLTDLQTYEKLISQDGNFHYIITSPRKGAGRARRIVVKNSIPKAALEGLALARTKMKSSDVSERTVAAVQRNIILQELEEAGILEWEVEL